MPEFIRVNFFQGELLSAADFQAEQNYFRNKTRWHNRVFHGWGVAHGLKVSVAGAEGGPTVIVEPGQALDPYGRELELCSPAQLPLPPAAKSVLVLARYVERFVDETPAKNADKSAVQAARVEEICAIILAEQKTAAAGIQSGNSPHVILGRVVRSSRGWRLDRHFKVQRTH